MVRIQKIEPAMKGRSKNLMCDSLGSPTHAGDTEIYFAVEVIEPIFQEIFYNEGKVLQELNGFYLAVALIEAKG